MFLDKTRQDKTRQDRPDQTRQDKARQSKTRQDKTRQDQTRESLDQTLEQIMKMIARDGNTGSEGSSQHRRHDNIKDMTT